MKILIHSRAKMLGLFLLSSIFLASCGGGSGGATTPSTAPIDANLFQKSSIAPSIAIYGFGDSSFVSTTETVTIAGAANSPSGKALTLTPTLNGSDLGKPTLDSNGFYSFSTKLIPGDNTLILTAKETDGLSKAKQIVISYVPNSTIAKDFSLNTSSVAEGDTKTLTAKLSFSDSSQVKTVEVFPYPVGAAIGAMKDDGILPDEIKADGLYTGNFSFSGSALGNKCFRAKITLANNETYYSGTACLTTFKLQTNETINLSAAISKSIAYLLTLEPSTATDFDKAKNVVAKIKAKSDYGNTFQSLQYDNIGNIYWVTKDGVSGAALVYTNDTRSLSNATSIGSSSAIYISPHESEFASPYSKMFSSISGYEAIDNNAPILDIKSRTVFDNLYNSGVVHISTHGGYMPVSRNGETIDTTILSTGEAPTSQSIECTAAVQAAVNWISGGGMPPSCLDYNLYISDISAGLYLPVTAGGHDVLAVTSLYLNTKLFGLNLKDSLIYIDACQSADGNDLANIFFSHGASIYIGYKNSVKNNYAIDFAKTFYASLINNNSVIDSFNSAINTIGADDSKYGNKNPASPKYLIRPGVLDVKLAELFLKNGDFESGSISPWQQAGDARVISTLGQYLPMDGKNMGILSTGLGYTTTSGAISQKALIQNTNSTLKFSWNYMSEEFKQYCGSTYQDYFKVTACKKDGTCDTLLNKKVDDFCSSVVQSNVVLNNGKPAVWATGWQNQVIDISAYRGKAITFKFEASDIGDSAYDTAVLLDGIKIE